MDLIVAVEKNWGIGCSGHLLTTVKEDMAWFRKQTAGKVLVYGRETLQTYPGGKVLPKRRNIILSRDLNYSAENAEVVHSLTELYMLLQDVPTEDVMVLGGASVYEQLLPYTKRAYVTKFDRSMLADRYFTNLDSLPNWRITDVSAVQYDAEQDLEFQFVTYENSDVKDFLANQDLPDET